MTHKLLIEFVHCEFNAGTKKRKIQNYTKYIKYKVCKKKRKTRKNPLTNIGVTKPTHGSFGGEIKNTHKYIYINIYITSCSS